VINQKNCREWSYILVMLIPLFYAILIGTSMFFYAGGSFNDPTSKGYTFWTNFLSDLGRTKALSGRANTVSCILFSVNYLIFGTFIIPFLLALPCLFSENDFQKKLSKIGSFFGIISALTLIGIALTPWDVYPELHGLFGGIQGFTIPVAFTLYSIVIYRNKSYPKQYAFLFIVILIIWIISAIISVSGVNMNTLEGLILLVIFQKITTFSTIFCLFVQAYGAWKLERSLK